MSNKTKHSRKSASKQSLAIKFIAPHIERARRVKELFNKSKTSYIIAIKDNDENIIVDSRSKSPTEHMQIFTHIFKSRASTAKLKAVTELLKMIESTNCQTFLGSPTFSEEEMKELKSINSRLEEILDDAVVRWQIEKPDSPMETVDLEMHEEFRKNRIIKSPEKIKPRLKTVK